MTDHRRFRLVLAVSVILAVLIASAPMFALADGLEPVFDPDTQFYVAKRNQGAIEQIADLTSSGDVANADLIRLMIETPQSVWFEAGSPHKIQQDVKNTVQRAAGKKTVPGGAATNVT